MPRFPQLLAVAAFFALAPVRAEAQLTWNWAFGTNTGTFITTGTQALPGTYTLTDFFVTSTGEGATLGSWSGGAYTPDGWGTFPPYSLTWDGSQVTRWSAAGYNSFDWLVFLDNNNPHRYFLFGWESGNVNTTLQSSYSDNVESASYALSVNPARTVTPEPVSMTLLATGLAGISAARIRRRRAA